MEKVSEKPGLVDSLLQHFDEKFSGKCEYVERDGKHFIVVDIEPGHEGKDDKAFYASYTEFRRQDDLWTANISSLGWTDLRDVRKIVIPSKKEVVYLVSRTEWNKLGGEAFNLKNEGIAKAIEAWMIKNSALAGSTDQLWAIESLMGKNRAQLTTVAAGLRPMAMEYRVLEDPHLASLMASVPNLKAWVRKDKVNHGHGAQERTAEAIYNPLAVRKVITEHSEIIEKLGLTGKSDEEIMEYVVSIYGGLRDPVEETEENFWARQQLLGLLLGYDELSTRSYQDLSERDESQDILSPDHLGSHSINSVPFNFYGSDYWVKNPEVNESYKALKKAYEALVERVEALLRRGLSPMETLAALNEEPELIQEQQSDVGKALKKAISPTQ